MTSKKQATDLTNAIERCQAVIQSFADEYVDCDTDDIITAIKARPEHYEALFNVISYQIGEIMEKATLLDLALHESA